MFDEGDEQKVSTLSSNIQLPLDRPKYGKMLVLYDNDYLVTLGPDYWCFLPTFIIFVISSICIMKMVITSTENWIFALSSVVICGGTCIAYLAVALSNPGIVTEENSMSIDDQEDLVTQAQTTRMCKKCGVRVKRKTYHCRSCDVCIEGYDHHCPWTSKCIGKGNICRFYIFLIMVPIFLVYIFVSFATVMSKNMMNERVHHLHPKL